MDEEELDVETFEENLVWNNIMADWFNKLDEEAEKEE